MCVTTNSTLTLIFPESFQYLAGHLFNRGALWQNRSSLAHLQETPAPMNKFEKVTVVRLANQYFGGQVTSRTVFFPNGEKKTLGIMMPGEYRFDTSKKELMEIQAGEVEVLLPGETVWQTMGEGDRFEVPANAEFDIKVNSVTDYCCSYID